MSHNHGIEETSIEALIEKQRRLACSGNRGRHGSALCDHHLRDCGIGASLVVKRVKSGMRRARLEGRQIGRARLDVDREQVVIDDRSGLSLTQVANKHRISRASVCRLMKEANDRSTPAVLIPAVEMAQRVGAGQ